MGQLRITIADSGEVEVTIDTLRSRDEIVDRRVQPDEVAGELAPQRPWAILATYILFVTSFAALLYLVVVHSYDQTSAGLMFLALAQVTTTVVVRLTRRRKKHGRRRRD